MKNRVIMSDAFNPAILKEYGIQQRPKGNQKTKERRRYLNVTSAFDIETSTIPEITQAIMYIWQFQIEEYTIIGRTWEEFKRFTRRIAEVLDDDVYLVCYVFNLSYEFQFLRGIYDFAPGEVFATESRKILRCDMLNHFEFRCAYRLTNMRLEKFLEEMDVEHKKLDGDEFNYKELRTPATMLTARQMEYCINDVLGLVEALKCKMELDSDNLYTIPMTATGYVRRIVKKRMRGFPREWLRDMLPNYPQYLLLKDIFRGGNTHGNRYYASRIVEDVISLDRSSSYPDCIITGKFPMSRFVEEEATIETMLSLMEQGRAVIVRFRAYGVKLRHIDYPVPYLAEAKCQLLDGVQAFNGRILRADIVETAMCDIDLRIFFAQYEFDDMEIIEMYSAKKGELPRAIVESVKEFYTKKTALKNVPGKEYEYSLAKSLLNSIYGMLVQSPIRAEIKYIDGEFTENFDDPEGELVRHNKGAWCCYQWGVYVSALARYWLERAIETIYDAPGAQFMYCDTDSVKYTGNVDFTALNNEIRANAIAHGSFAKDPKNKIHYTGVYEWEGCYNKFVQFGAKKYAYTDEEGKTHITIAGVNKKKGAEELDEHGGITALHENFLFVKGGGTDLIYNDDPEITSYTLANGETVAITSNVVIKDSTYQMGLTGEFRRIMLHPELWAQATTDFR